jgi:hypothetical protein
MPTEKDIPHLAEVIDGLKQIKERHGHILNDYDYLERLPAYYEARINPRKEYRIGNCLAALTIMIITPNGGVDVCGYGPFNITLRDKSLRQMWYSWEYYRCRRRVKRCRRQCMYLCYEKVSLSLLFKQIVESYTNKIS